MTLLAERGGGNHFHTMIELLMINGDYGEAWNTMVAHSNRLMLNIVSPMGFIFT